MTKNDSDEKACDTKPLDVTEQVTQGLCDETIGYMRSVGGNDDYGMFVNERPEGGFEWKFLDFKPEDIENYKPIYISLTPQARSESQNRIKELEKEIEELKRMIDDER